MSSHSSSPYSMSRQSGKGSSGLADDMYHIIAGKMMESQRPQPDVVHIAHAYSMRSNMEGV